MHSTVWPASSRRAGPPCSGLSAQLPALKRASAAGEVDGEMQHRRQHVLADPELVLEHVADRAARRHQIEPDLVEPGDRQLDQPQARQRRQALVEAERDQHLGAAELLHDRGAAIAIRDLQNLEPIAEAGAQQARALAGEPAVQHHPHATSPTSGTAKRSIPLSGATPSPGASLEHQAAVLK